MKKVITLIVLLGLWCSTAQASVVVTNGLTHRYDMAASATQKGYVMLQNVSDKPQRVLVYKNDLRVGCSTEQLDVAEAGTLERSNASWIKLGLEERVLAPGEKYSLTYQIDAPAKELSGSYWSLLMVEVKKPIDTASVKRGVQVTSNVRYAVQLITNFQTKVPTEVKFGQVQLNDGPQGKQLDVKLENGCDKLVQPILKLEVYDNNGEIIYTKTAETKKLYPTQCRTFVLPVADIPKGKYQAVLVADCGETDLFGMTLNLDVNE